MGYFSNGTEGMDYQARYCERCAHDVNNDCPILMLHLLWNYEACKDKEKDMALNSFIPRSKNGAGNEQCKMFTPINDNSATVDPIAEAHKLAAWNSGKALDATK